MKQETIITAAVFLSVGFLAGYVYNAQRNAASTEAAASVQRLQEAVRPGGGSRDGVRGADTAPASADATQPDSSTTSTAAPSGEPSSTGLPPGHPAIDAAARIRFLEEKAAKQPNDPKLRLQLANFFYDQKQFGQAIDWYEQRMAVEKDKVARAIVKNAQKEEFKHFGMDLEFLLRKKPQWRETLQGILFQPGDIVKHGDEAEEESEK